MRQSTTVQKKARAIPSAALIRSSNSPAPMARVCGMPRSGPNASLRSAYRMNRANWPAGNAGISGSTRVLWKVTVQVTAEL